MTKELILFEKKGETRRRTIALVPGERVELKDRGTMVVQARILIDVSETYGEGYWSIKSYFTNTVRAAPPTRWERFVNWLTRRKLPKAIVVDSKKTDQA